MSVTAPSQNSLAEPYNSAITSRSETHPPRVTTESVTVSLARPNRPAGSPIGEGEAQQVSALRRVAAAKVNQWGCTSLIDHVQLLTSELLTNAVVHGAGTEIGFTLTYLPQVAVRIEVSDGSTVLPQKRCPSPAEEHGRGIVIIDALADAWGTSADGKTTWCVLNPSTPGSTE